MQRIFHLAIATTLFSLVISALPISVQSAEEPVDHWDAALSSAVHSKSGSTNSPYTFLPFRLGGSTNPEGSSGSSGSSSGGSGGSAGSGGCQVGSDIASDGSQCGGRAASERPGGE
ncbi:MAG: hypothetical protein KME15_20190 [Drouetiella hepatica Uher 2000/2452]|jgi:uncharacterized membrane protein YgcG|uniref:Uncharacterized protein n=1 Tax=Drouetiella hepatica Uher 2000/2452 TaxID=904376 RepID=A0A951QE07_9CYAN|nr:hypothetical protein [Drouetiella hepatica Uher 2000/2452]